MGKKIVTDSSTASEALGEGFGEAFRPVGVSVACGRSARPKHSPDHARSQQGFRWTLEAQDT